MHFDYEEGLYLTPDYLDKFFKAVSYFIDDEKSPYNKKYPLEVAHTKETIENIKKELYGYYKDCKTTNDELEVFKANKIEILAKYDSAKVLAKHYVYDLLKFIEGKDDDKLYESYCASKQN